MDRDKKREGRGLQDRPSPDVWEKLLPRGDLIASLFRGGASGRVEYPVAVPEVCPECSLGDEQLLALMLHQDRAIGLEEPPRGPLRGEFDLLLGGR